MGDFERDDADTYLWRAGLLHKEEKGMTIGEQVFGNVFEMKRSKCCGVLMRHCRKLKGEQVITLQMAQ